ncbi:hypothetical protein OS493_033716 [Desmophyllum pertusum]|uniref:Uncharacterized protein n=1 Tax=Desmophyllum pertusum TaxID=174260 RepID=A0A9W9ZJU0_9CNID|nr:hypothetical protein OS493_033716 [Desmophyllum pertusum]
MLFALAGKWQLTNGKLEESFANKWPSNTLDRRKCTTNKFLNDFTADGQLARDWKRLNRTSLLHNNSFWTNPPTMEQLTKDWKRSYLYHDNRFKDETRSINVDINKQSKALLSNKLF